MKLFAVVLIALGLLYLAGCRKTGAPAVSTPATPAFSQSPSPSPSPSPAGPSKTEIGKTLTTQKAYDVTWSPDSSMVVYIVDTADSSKIFAWKTGENDPKFLTVNGGTTSGFSWSPDSAYFLINVGHMGPGTITSTLYDAKTLESVTPDLVTVSPSPPVWSPDSRYIALSTASQDNSGSIAVTVYSVADKKTTTLVSKTNTTGFFKILSWTDGIISYMETDSSGNTTNKTVAFPG
ncbi:hypothetical protein AAFA46_04670 [Oscillospiraceae bacterium WX1]